MSAETAEKTTKRPKPQRKTLKPNEPFDTCVECGYERGFHLAPSRARRSVKAAQVSLLLKCPNCGAVYDAGLHAAAE